MKNNNPAYNRKIIVEYTNRGDTVVFVPGKEFFKKTTPKKNCFLFSGFYF
jgi:hypothetical protein